VADYREISDGPFDAIASIGMVEHVGASQIDVYARQVARLVRPGGRILNHGIARVRHSDAEAGPFSERYVFPDAAPLHLSRILLALERAGIVAEHVEGFASDYATTLEHWARNLDANLAEATRLAGPERVRRAGTGRRARPGAATRPAPARRVAMSLRRASTSGGMLHAS